MKKIRAVICGGSGYTGAELLRILNHAVEVEITAVTSEQSAGKQVTELFPHLHAYSSVCFEPLIKEALLDKGDVFFLALPHSASQAAVAFFHSHGKKVIDLSADYRLRDITTYERWYKTKHDFPDTLKHAVFGLPELYRSEIKNALLIANPGCYPTTAILALYPALRQKIITIDNIVIDSKSGVSGAGRKSEVAYSFCEVTDGFRAYGVALHRHTPEIEQELSVIAGAAVNVTFTPHLLPVARGMLSTVYAPLKDKATCLNDVHAIYADAYKDEPFVDVLPIGKYPDIRNVRGTNICQIGLAVSENGTLIIISAIDNLVKGASGQAVQNMNLMFGLDETAGLDLLPVVP
ncbi:MAG: N-acetyl-gamma-glutamyl-phosphate reductase [Candidatus Magnetominusculus sp. LBB02]|nr:N-acetyl-gamma-glutamyl-phosphate reductase [Candidatus Magnetominusculus sp. LBB02]